MLTNNDLDEIMFRRGVRTIATAGGDLVGEGDRDVSRLVGELRAERTRTETLRAALEAIINDSWWATGGTVTDAYVIDPKFLHAAVDVVAPKGDERHER